MAFPGTILSLAHAASTNLLNVLFGGSVKHTDGLNLMIDDIAGLGTKVGLGASTPTGGKILEGTSVAGETQWLDRLTPSMLPNGEFRVDQSIGPYTSTGSRNNDGSHTLDGTWLLSDGNNIVSVTQELTDVPAGAVAACKLICTTANKKAGIVKFLTYEQAAEIINGTASAAFVAHTTTAKVVNKLRAALIGWSGAADAFTRDVVNTTNWGASGANPTLATNWAYLSTPVDLTLTTAYQATPFKMENVAVGAGVKNVGLFVWIDDTDMALTDEVFIADLHVEPGPISHKLKRTTGLAAELACMEQWWVLNGALSGNGATLANSIATGYTTSTTNAEIRFEMPVPMRAIPAQGGVGNWQVVDSAGSAFTVAAFAAGSSAVCNRKTMVLSCTISAATAGRYCYIRPATDATARLTFDARPGV